MALPEFRLLETAIVLAEELHFSRAAARLRIDQATVSRRIQELEGEIGFPLFERNHQFVELTEAGRRFVEEVRLAQMHVERAIQSGRTAREDAEVVLNIGRSPYTDPFLITTLLSVKLPLYPRLKVELSQQFSLDLIREVLGGGLDLAIATEPPESKRLTTVKISESPFYIAIPEEDEPRLRRFRHSRHACREALGDLRAPDAPSCIRRRDEAGEGTRGRSSETPSRCSSRRLVFIHRRRWGRGLRGEVGRDSDCARRDYCASARGRCAHAQDLSCFSRGQQLQSSKRIGQSFYAQALDVYAGHSDSSSQIGVRSLNNVPRF